MSDFLALPEPTENSDPSWFGFPIRVKKKSPFSRNKLVKNLNANNIGTRLLFGGNLMKQPIYKNINSRTHGKLENTNTVMENVFWLGLHPALKREMLECIIDTLIRLLINKR